MGTYPSLSKLAGWSLETPRGVTTSVQSPIRWCHRARIVSGVRHVLLCQEDSVIETQSRSRERRFQRHIPTRFGPGTSPRATLRAALALIQKHEKIRKWAIADLKSEIRSIKLDDLRTDGAAGPI